MDHAPHEPLTYDRHIQAGEFAFGQGECARARQAFQTAARLRPRDIKAWASLATLERIDGNWDAALKYFQHLRTLPHGSTMGLVGAAKLWLLRGELDEAQAAAELAMEQAPASLDATTAWYVSLQYQPDLSANDLTDAARWLRDRGGEIQQAPAPRHNSGRPLRIGYLSPDFCSHSVLWFFEPLLRAHQHEQFTWYGYALGTRRDEYTERLRTGFDHWRDLQSLDAKHSAARIAEDQLDVLVDLAGRFGEAQPGLFAWRPAPVQLHYLGFCGATGIRGIDYRIVDTHTDPIGSTLDTGETLLRPDNGRGFHVYNPIAPTPPVAASPWKRHGVMTLGSFNAYPKLNSQVLELWAKLLLTIPNTRLVLRCESFADTTTRKACATVFRKQGLAQERLELRPPTPSRENHFAQYGDIDVALDPFPYNGVTTTCDALWQGVPVATVRGNRHSGRIGESLLTASGLSDWVFDDPDDLLARLPSRLAAPESLPDRVTLADNFRRNQIARAPTLARDLESIYAKLARSTANS